MGPLKGVKIIEVGGIGPGPFCGMMLSDMGAEITRIERKGGLALSEPKFDLLTRNRKSVSMNLRKPEGVEDAAQDAGNRWMPLQEGFRPGVMEKLGIGPDVLPGTKPQARLRPDDRLGARGASGACGRTRHQLYCTFRCPAHHRP